MIKCTHCNDTGTIDTGNNDLPCSCPLGDAAQFNVAGVQGAVAGAEIKQHFYNNSPQPLGNCNADSIPGRHK